VAILVLVVYQDLVDIRVYRALVVHMDLVAIVVVVAIQEHQV